MNLLLQEWKICEEGIGRYDTLTFAVRGWAVSILIATIAAAVAAKTPAMVLAATGSTFTFWIVDALNKTYQRQFIDRAKELEILLDHSLKTPGSLMPDAKYPGLASRFEARRDKRLKAFPDIMRAAMETNVWLPYAAMVAVIAVSYCIAPRLSAGSPPSDSAPPSSPSNAHRTVEATDAPAKGNQPPDRK